MTQIPERFMAWHSIPNLSHIGTWATERYPEEAVEVVRADTIPALRAENERLREALKFYAANCDATETTSCGYDGNLCCATARAALIDAPAPARTGDLMEDAARHAAKNPIPAPAQTSVQEDITVTDPQEARDRLLAGDAICYSQDGDAAWFRGGDGAFVSDAVVWELRNAGHLIRKDDEYRVCWDVASDALRALSGETKP